MKNHLEDYAIGTMVFGDWKVVEDLGSGSYGTVYKIEKTEYGIVTHAALKVIRVPKTQSEIRDILGDGMDEKSVTSYFQGMVDSLVREIAVMSTLKSHPNIVTYENHKVISHPGTIGWDILIQMELLTSLRDYQNEHPMTEADVRRLAVDMCSALVFCQKKALIHRDIKPQNIFISEAGQFKLGDFGVARTMDKTVGSLSKQGTEDYMAPEVYKGQKYGPNVDIYSLGLVLYRLMNNNRLPFMPPAPKPVGFGDRLNALTDRIEGEKPIAPPCNASPEFARIILKACAHDPKDRYQTAAEMLEALNGCIPQTKTEGPEMASEEKPVAFGNTDNEETDRPTLGPFFQPSVGPGIDQEGETLGPNFGPRKEIPPMGGFIPPVPARQEKKSRTNLIIGIIAGVAALVVVVFAAIIILLVLTNNDTQPSNYSNTQPSATLAPQETTAALETTEAPSQETEEEKSGTQVKPVLDDDGKIIGQYLCDADGTQLAYSEYSYNCNGDGYTSKITFYAGGSPGDEIYYDPEGSYAERRYEFDECGRVCKFEDYDFDGKRIRDCIYSNFYDYSEPISSWQVSEYDANGNEIANYHFMGDGSLRWVEMYDSDGKRTWGLSYYVGIGGPYCECEYDSNGNEITRTYYNEDGTLDSWHTYEYNSDGLMISEFTYRDDGTLEFESKYDSSGNEIALYAYNRDGTLDLWYEYTYDEDGNKVSTKTHYENE